MLAKIGLVNPSGSFEASVSRQAEKPFRCPEQIVGLLAAFKQAFAVDTMETSLSCQTVASSTEHLRASILWLVSPFGQLCER